MIRRLSSVSLEFVKLLRDTSATTAAEFALVVPVFILLTFGTISIGIAFSAITQMHFAAEKAARCLAVDVGGNCPDVNAYAKSYYSGPGMTSLTFASQTGTCGPADKPGKKVVGSGTYQFITGFRSTALNLSASACYPVI